MSRTRSITQLRKEKRRTATLRRRRDAEPPTSRLPPRSGSAELDLLGVPALDLRSQPEARSAASEVEDRTRHVWMSMEVEAYRVPVSEPEDACDVMCVDGVIEEHSAGHGASLHLATDNEYTCDLSVRPRR